MNMHEAGVLAILDRQRNFREVDRTQRRPVIGIGDQLVGNFDTDIFLCFLGGTTDMRGQDHVRHTAKRALEFLVLARRLDREHVKGCTGQMAAFQGRSKVFDHDDIATCRVDQVRPRLHLGDFGRGDHVFGLFVGRNMQRNDIRFRQQFIHRTARGCVTHRKLVDHIIINDVHAKRFRQNRQLRSDMTIADDAQSLAARLVRALGIFKPATSMGSLVTLRDTAHQHDDLAQNQFGDRTCIGIGRIEDRNTAHRSGFQINLIGADTETTDRGQLGCSVDDFFGQFGAGTDAQKMRFGDDGFQFIRIQSSRVVVDI